MSQGWVWPKVGWGPAGVLSEDLRDWGVAKARAGEQGLE